MAEIDYAFIADFAKVDQAAGTLTVVGASWTHMVAGQLPTTHNLSVAGRVRARVDDAEVPLLVIFRGPDDTVTMELTGTVGAGPKPRPYGDGLVGLLWSLNVNVLLPVPGLYTVEVVLPEDDVSRMLAFEVEQGPGAAGE